MSDIKFVVQLPEGMSRVDIVSKSKRASSTEGRLFAERLIELMDERALSVRDAAKICGSPASTISSWRAGALPTQFTPLKKLAHHLGTNLSFLLTGETERGDDSLPDVSEVFADGGPLFDGYAKITIQRLLPRQKKKGDGK